MPRQLPLDLRTRVIATLQLYPQGAGIAELRERLQPALSRRSLQRKLAEWVKEGAIRAEGEGKGRRYFAAAVAVPMQEARIEGQGEVHIRLSAEASELRDRVRRPLSEREPIG